jgi:hypothetical protein
MANARIRNPINNLTAKHSRHRGGAHKDRRRESRLVRNNKHKKREPQWLPSSFWLCLMRGSVPALLFFCGLLFLPVFAI